MKVLKIIGVVLVSIAAVVFLATIFLPSTTHMERSVSISVSPQRVYQELISYRNFNAWSPWYEKDTTTAYTYEGPAYGVGSKVSWKSDSPDVGSGSMEIIGTEDQVSITSLMKFDGFDSEPTATLRITAEENGSTVTWTYDESNVKGVGKIFGAMMDTFLGPDYERGLQKLKAWLESAPAATTEISVTTVSPVPYLGILDSTANDQALISSKMASNYGRLSELLSRNSLEMGGSPFAIYTDYTPESITFICALPFRGVLETAPAGTFKDTNYGGLAIKSVFKGDYSGLELAHSEIDAYAKFAGYEIIGPPWEEYVTDPMTEPDPSKWITLVFYPVK